MRTAHILACTVCSVVICLEMFTTACWIQNFVFWMQTSELREVETRDCQTGSFNESVQISAHLLRKMTLKSKKGINLLMPLNLRTKSASRFCMFSKVRSDLQISGASPVYLNVYDLTPMNGYIYWAGLGIFHSGVEVHGVEYAFGAHDYPISGVFEVEPRQCPGFRFRKSIFVGTTNLDPLQVREFMEHQSANYNGDTYHLIIKNCNHFCEDISFKLTGKPIPKWVNRLARIGAVCNCVLPESLKIAAVRQDPMCQTEEEDNEKRRLTGALSCFSSISLCPRQLSSSHSLFMCSPSKGPAAPSWDLTRSTTACLKDD